METKGDQLDTLMLAYNNSGKGLQEGNKLVEYIVTYKKGQHTELIAEVGIRVA